MMFNLHGPNLHSSNLNGPVPAKARWQLRLRFAILAVALPAALIFVQAAQAAQAAHAAQDEQSAQAAQSSQTKLTWPSTLGLERDGLVNTLTAVMLNSVTVPASKTIVVQSPVTNVTLGHTPRYYIRYLLSGDKTHGHELVFIVPGFGDEHDHSVGQYFMEMLRREGYSVAIMDSPASPRFIKESSRWAMPGIASFDGKDLLEGMVLAREELAALGKTKVGAEFEITQVSALGLSLGGLNVSQSLLAANRNSNKDKLQFHRVIAVNPPTSNIYGLSVIDAMVLNSKMKNDSEKSRITTLFDGLIKLILPMPTFETLEAAALNAISTSAFSPFSKEDAEFLIGLSFSANVEKAVRAWLEIQNIHGDDGQGLRNHPAVRAKTFYDIFNLITLPLWNSYHNFPREGDLTRWPSLAVAPMNNINQEFFKELRKNDGVKSLPELGNNGQVIYRERQEVIGDTLTRLDDQLIEKSSIRENAADLQKENFVLITFADDFLLRSDDANWIATTFSGGDKGRSKVFPFGGHLGGLYRKEFRDHLLESLK